MQHDEGYRQLPLAWWCGWQRHNQSRRARGRLGAGTRGTPPTARDAEREDAWTKPTRGTRWTNEQLLFHMVFGYMVVQRLLLLVRVLGRFPDGVSRIYAGLLDAATRPFDLINYYGSRAAATVYNRHRMGAKMNRVIASLRRSLARSTDEALRQGMHFPTRWDRSSRTT